MILHDEDRYVLSQRAVQALWEAEALIDFCQALLGYSPVDNGPVKINPNVLHHTFNALKGKLESAWEDAEQYSPAELPLPRPDLPKRAAAQKRP